MVLVEFIVDTSLVNFLDADVLLKTLAVLFRSSPLMFSQGVSRMFEGKTKLARAKIRPCFQRESRAKFASYRRGLVGLRLMHFLSTS